MTAALVQSNCVETSQFLAGCETLKQSEKRPWCQSVVCSKGRDQRRRNVEDRSLLFWSSELRRRPDQQTSDYNCYSTTILLWSDSDPTTTYRGLAAIAYITIATRLRYNDTTTYSTTTEVIEIMICVRFDCNTTTTRLRRKIGLSFLLASNGSRRARYVVVGS